ncbi:MAG: CotH kinase family protein [Oscillospiraceae bacterium]|nr:CotH kinase family protein [Oscillospiraceae bacterium]
MVLSILDKKRCCLEVEILSGQEDAWLQEYEYRDYSNYLYYNGQKVPVDVETSTIYIAQDIGPDAKPEDLPGSLKLDSSRYRLVFAPDEAFNDLAQAVADNHSFRLCVTDHSGEYMEYNLVFTTLPVLRIDGEAFALDERDREINRGNLCLWTPNDPDTGRYSLRESDVHWHIRGGSSSYQPKTPWKLSLKKQDGANKNMSMLGLGSDDDWILNPMNLDDTKLKEYVFIRLWNENAAQRDCNPRMSPGEYVEVVMNGKYMGLFQLQRRIDGKYLNLESTDILLKGRSVWEAATPADAYEIVTSALREQDTYDLMQDFFHGRDLSLLHLDNYLDTVLFLQYASASDNMGYKNMFYVLRGGKDGYRLHMLPWDTDLSWGVVWNEGFAYDYLDALDGSFFRVDVETVEAHYPDLIHRLALRWAELRAGVLSEENVLTTLQTGAEELTRCGVMERDVQLWGQYYQGMDTPENLARFLEEKLLWLDDFYSEYLQ